MARKRNSVRSEKVTLTIAPLVRDYLETLTMFGVYGRNAAEVAATLVNDELKAFLKQDDDIGRALRETRGNHQTEP